MAPRAIAPKGMTRRRPGLSLACGDPHRHAHTGPAFTSTPHRAAPGSATPGATCVPTRFGRKPVRCGPRWPGSWPIFAGCGQRSRTIRVRAGVLTNGEGGIRTLVRREPRNRFSRPAHDRENAGGYRGFSVRGTKKGMRGHFRVVLGGLAVSPVSPVSSGRRERSAAMAVAGEPARCRQRRFGVAERASIGRTLRSAAAGW